MAWNKHMGGLPSLAVMVGRYLGYKPPEGPQKEMTQEEHAARLMGSLLKL
jgi:hypothetical protein